MYFLDNYVVIRRLYDLVIVFVLNDWHPVSWFIMQVLFNLHALSRGELIHIFIFRFVLMQHRRGLWLAIIVIRTKRRWSILRIIVLLNLLLRLLHLNWRNVGLIFK
jgi:hypothetical protein